LVKLVHPVPAPASAARAINARVCTQLRQDLTAQHCGLGDGEFHRAADGDPRHHSTAPPPPGPPPIAVSEIEMRIGIAIAQHAA
jgi:hypothetical protein